MTPGSGFLQGPLLQLQWGGGSTGDIMKTIDIGVLHPGATRKHDGGQFSPAARANRSILVFHVRVRPGDGFPRDENTYTAYLRDRYTHAHDIDVSRARRDNASWTPGPYWRRRWSWWWWRYIIIILQLLLQPFTECCASPRRPCTLNSLVRSASRRRALWNVWRWGEVLWWRCARGEKVTNPQPFASTVM